MLDLYCSTCGEPWDMDTVLHEEPAAFERARNGRGAIVRCPVCKVRGPQSAERRTLILEVHDALGTDLDGIAAELADIME